MNEAHWRDSAWRMLVLLLLVKYFCFWDRELWFPSKALECAGNKAAGPLGPRFSKTLKRVLKSILIFKYAFTSSILFKGD